MKKEQHSIDSEINLLSIERELELCKKLGGDVEEYRRLSLSVHQLEQIRLGLESGIDTSKYTDPSISWIDMENIRIALETGIDTSEFLKKGYNWLQCNEIREGLKDGLDISWYENIKFLSSQMKEIRKGLAEGLDVRIYADTEYDSYQMKQIRYGLEKNLDVSKYAKKEYKHLTMRAIRLAMQLDIDLVPYADKGYKGKELIELKRGFERDVDLSEYLEKGYEAEQLEQINNAYDKGVDLIPYLSPDFYGAQLNQIIIGLESHVDVTIYAKKYFNWFQMREIRQALEEKLDVTFLLNSDFSHRQMHEIKRGLKNNLDVSEFAKVYYEPEQISEIITQLEHDNIKAKLNILNESKELIDIESLSDEVDEAIDDTEALEQDIIDDIDNYISITEDKLKAYINLPRKEQGYSMIELGRMLRHNDVKQGIKQGILQKIIDDELYDQEVLIAEGKEPHNGNDGEYIFHFNTNPNRKPKLKSDGSVDFKSLELFEVVEEGQLLAEYRPATAGGFGYDVTGTLIQPERGKDLLKLKGKGFKYDEGTKKYTALIDGIVELSNEDTLEVRNVFAISGDVNVSTGNIDFQGDVHIGGNVESGFSINATGNVTIEGRCDAATIYAGKDIIIKKGCQGQGEGEICAGGSIFGQFFESVTLLADCDIEASYLLNCNVKALGKLSVEGRRGIIIGGKICAKKGVDCFSIGNAVETKTVIDVGIDKEDMLSYQNLMKMISKIDSEINTISEAIEKLMLIPEKNTEQEGLYNRLTKALYLQKQDKKKLISERENKLHVMNEQKAARVNVSGVAYPGVELMINSEIYKIKDAVRSASFVRHKAKIEVVPR